MRKAKNTQRSKTVGFALFPRQLEKLKKLVETGDYASMSEIIRQAINLFYNENDPTEPEYVKQIRNKEEKARQEKEIQERIKNISNEEYCEKVLHGIVDGDTCALPPYGAFTAKLTDIRKFEASAIEGFQAKVPVLARGNKSWNENQIMTKYYEKATEILKGIDPDSQEYWQKFEKIRSRFQQTLNKFVNKELEFKNVDQEIKEQLGESPI